MRTAAIERDDGPAKAGPGQAFVIETIAKGSGKGEAKRYRAIYAATPLLAALKAKRITYDEFAAGDFYRALYERLERSGKDSTEFTIVGAGSGTPWTQTQADAFKLIRAIEDRLPLREQNWALIVRKFCGEGFEAREACRLAGIKDPRFVWQTMRLALSKLSAAIEGTRV